MIKRSKRFRLVPAPIRRALYERCGWYWYWTLVGNVRRGPAAELRALRIYLRSRRPLWAPPRQFLLALIGLYLRTAPEDESLSGLPAYILTPEIARNCIHDTTGYEDPTTTITFIPGVGRGIRDSASGRRREGEVG